MKRYYFLLFAYACAALHLLSCEILDDDVDKHVPESADSTYVGLDEVAELLASDALSLDNVHEVFSAVSSSSGNGYDEEYTMKNIFESPGIGVGGLDSRTVEAYQHTLRDLIERRVYSMTATRSGGATMDPEAYLAALEASDIQIYWPFSEEWDKETMPTITFDPEDGSEINVGYRLIIEDDGTRHMKEVLVDEVMAKETPVWVVNRNDDAGFTTLEMLRREDPEWGEGGGTIIVKPTRAPLAKAEGDSSKVLILREFTMNRNYDSWFAGASEFFVKIGYVEDFTASTEAELKLYNPSVTDFMIVVRRSQVGEPQPFNAILMTDWSDCMDFCAFMVTEDDGGTQEDWTVKAKAYVAGKSYGVEITLPLNIRDDIVWRGKLSYSSIENYCDKPAHFGDVDLTFGIEKYPEP